MLRSKRGKGLSSSNLACQINNIARCGPWNVTSDAYLQKWLLKLGRTEQLPVAIPSRAHVKDVPVPPTSQTERHSVNTPKLPDALRGSGPSVASSAPGDAPSLDSTASRAPALHAGVASIDSGGIVPSPQVSHDTSVAGDVVASGSQTITMHVISLDTPIGKKRRANAKFEYVLEPDVLVVPLVITQSWTKCSRYDLNLPRIQASFAAHYQIWVRLQSQVGGGIVCEDDARRNDEREMPSIVDLPQSGITVLGGVLRTRVLEHEEELWYDNTLYLEVLAGMTPGINRFPDASWTMALAYYVPQLVAKALVAQVNSDSSLTKVDRWLWLNGFCEYLCWPNPFRDDDVESHCGTRVHGRVADLYLNQSGQARAAVYGKPTIYGCDGEVTKWQLHLTQRFWMACVRRLSGAPPQESAHVTDVVDLASEATSASDLDCSELRKTLRAQRCDVFEGHMVSAGRAGDLVALIPLSARRIAQIGFNAGHSAYLFLQNSRASVFSFASKHTAGSGRQHTFAIAVRCIGQKFDARHTVHIGVSRVSVPKFIRLNAGVTFDLISFDGGHSLSCARADLRNCAALAHPQTVLVMDDVHVPARKAWERGPTAAWQETCSLGLVRECGRLNGLAWGQCIRASAYL